VSLKHGILLALRCNTKLIHNSKEHTGLLSNAKLFSTDFNTIRKKDFAISKLMQKIWNTKKRFHISNTLRNEIKLLHHIFSNLNDFPFVTPIAHIINRTPDFVAKGEACVDGAGGFSEHLTFWWFIEWPPNVKNRTVKYFMKYYYGMQGNKLSINLLEYIAINISLVAAATRMNQGFQLSHPNPLLSILSDNTIAISWTRKTATSTKEGKHLSRTTIIFHCREHKRCCRCDLPDDNTSTQTHLYSTFSDLPHSYRFASIPSQSEASLQNLGRTVCATSASIGSNAYFGSFQSRYKIWLKFLSKHKLSTQKLLAMSSFDIDFIYACFTLDLTLDQTFWFRAIRTSTIKLYLKAASCPMRLQTISYSRLPSFPPLVKDILDEYKKWEEVPNQREPFTVYMLTYLHRTAKTSYPDSYDAAVFDWLLIDIFAGFRKTEWMQDSHSYKTTGTYQKVSKDGSARAFIALDFSFFPPSQTSLAEKSTTPHGQLHLTWRYQKNCQNGQKISYNHNIFNEDFSVVLAAQRILQRAKRLHVPADHPIAVFSTNNKFSFFNHVLIESTLRTAAKQVYKITSIKYLSLFSSHSIRVGACVLLHSLQQDPLFIQFRLRWRSLSFMNYLRNTPRIAALHNYVFNTSREIQTICS